MATQPAPEPPSVAQPKAAMPQAVAGAAGWMGGALLSFCLMALAGRELAGAIGTFQILLARSAIGLFVIALLLWRTGQLNRLRTTRLGLHALRNGFHFAGQYGWFLGLGLLPLAQVFALEFTTPLWTLVLAALFLGESFTVRKLLAVLLGLAGVAVILRPERLGAIDSASLIVLAAAAAYAVAHTGTKALTRTEHPLTVLFYMCLLQLPLGLLPALQQWVWPDARQTGWLLAVGLSALGAHFCMTRAMRLADAGVVVTLDFLRLPLIALVGVWVYHEPFDVLLMAGAALMLVGNLLNLLRSRR